MRISRNNETFLPVFKHASMRSWIFRISAIMPTEVLLECKTTTNAWPSVIYGVMVAFQNWNFSPSDSILRNIIRSLYALFAAVAYASFTSKCAKEVNVISRHADWLPSSRTGGKNMSILRSLSKYTPVCRIFSARSTSYNCNITVTFRPKHKCYNAKCAVLPLKHTS